MQRKKPPSTERKAAPPVLKPGVKAKLEHRDFWLYGSLVLALIATLFCYSSSFSFKYTNWDDPMYIHGNTVIHELTTANVKEMFTSDAVLNYHPLTQLSLALDYHRARDLEVEKEKDPAPFHQTNILIHLLNVILVFFFIYLLSDKRLLVAFLVSFLFGIHPMHVESVSWISERKDGLYTFFFLLCLITWLYYIKKKTIRLYLASFLLFLLALLSKPAAVPTGIVLLLLDYYRQRFNFSLVKPSGWKNLVRGDGLKAMLEKIPFIIAGIILIYITFEIQKKTAIAEFHAFTLTQRLMFSTYGFCMYLIKLFVPVGLSAYYPYPALSGGGYLPGFFYISVFIAMAVLALCFWPGKEKRLISFGLMFYLVMLILVLQFISVGGTIMSDRYTYVPYIGIFFILAMVISRFFESGRRGLKYWRYPVAFSLAIYLMALTVTAQQRTLVWKNSETLWNDVISKYTNIVAAYKNRAIHYVSFPETYDKALRDFQMAEQLGSKDPR
ncbi:MAG: hypothetical protein NTU44_13135, partial [Bacteroidetes bacterium]|nr:hypothetical protein [Bacteroidota bacterium]